jgi:hypothetical protein
MAILNTSVIDGLDKLIEKSTRKCKYEKTKQVKRVKRIHEYLLEEGVTPVGLNFEVKGDLILKELRKSIRRFRLTSQQLIFSEIFIQSQLKFIYREDFYANELRIKEENDVDELFQYALICCPRRFGKTFLTGIFAACLLLCVPDTKIVLFSPGKRQSTMIMALIRANLDYLKNFSDWEYTKNNTEELIIVVDGNHRSCLGLPAKEETTRGSGGTCIICEEAAAMPPKFFVKVVLPVTGPEFTSCLCISTVKGNSAEGMENWYTQLLELTHPDGKPFFNIFKFYLACEQCIKEDKAASCTHKLHELPWWQDPTKQLLLRSIMEQLNYADSSSEELQGIVKSNMNNVYPHDKILRLFNPQLTAMFDPFRELLEPPPFIFISIDVSNGGDKSRTSLMSMYQYQGQLIITGAESIPSKTAEDYRDILIAHIKQLRHLPKLERCQLVVCIENNTVGPARQVMYDLLDLNLPFIKIMTKNGVDITHSDLYEGVKNRQFGVRTQGKQGEGNQKEEMVYALKRAIMLNQFRFSKDFFILTPEQTPDKYKKSLMDQLMAYSVKVQMSQSLSFHKPKRVYDGKHAGPDDDCLVMMLGNYWLMVYLDKQQNGRH